MEKGGVLVAIMAEIGTEPARSDKREGQFRGGLEQRHAMGSAKADQQSRSEPDRACRQPCQPARHIGHGRSANQYWNAGDKWAEDQAEEE